MTKTEIIQEFLGKADPKEIGIRKALGLTKTEMQVFWAALNAAGEDLVIPDLAKTAGRVVKFPSPYMSKLGKLKFLTNTGRGKWSVSEKVADKLKAVLSGEAVPDASAGKKPSPKKGKKKAKKRVGKKPGPKPARKSKKSGALSGADLLDRMQKEHDALASKIKKLGVRRDALAQGIAVARSMLK